jgi:hypothetical protein
MKTVRFNTHDMISFAKYVWLNKPKINEDTEFTDLIDYFEEWELNHSLDKENNTHITSPQNADIPQTIK